MRNLPLVLLAIGALACLLVWLAPHIRDSIANGLPQYMARTGLLLPMTTLAVNKPRTYELGDRGMYPVIATDIIYEGAAVGENASGYARPLAAADPFLGFAIRKADNSTGAAGAINVEVQRKGQIVLPIASIAITANDHPVVYASDDDTFTLTATSNSPIGRVSRWISTGLCVVDFDSTMAAEIVARLAGDV